MHRFLAKYEIQSPEKLGLQILKDNYLIQILISEFRLGRCDKGTTKWERVQQLILHNLDYINIYYLLA